MHLLGMLKSTSVANLILGTVVLIVLLKNAPLELIYLEDIGKHNVVITLVEALVTMD